MPGAAVKKNATTIQVYFDKVNFNLADNVKIKVGLDEAVDEDNNDVLHIVITTTCCNNALHFLRSRHLALNECVKRQFHRLLSVRC